MKPLISILNLAERLNVKPGTVRGWISKGLCPTPDIRAHRFVRWEEDTIQEFLENPILWREKNIEIKANQDANKYS